MHQPVPAQFLTIQQAVENAREGDKILVLGGTYPGGIVIDKALILESKEGRATTKIAGPVDQAGIRVLRTTGTVIRGFTINGARVGISAEAASELCIEQNEISHNLGSGIEYAGGLVDLVRIQEAKDLTIANNVITNNVGFGISSVDLLRAKIFGNEISDIARTSTGIAGQGISVRGGSRVEIRNNKVSRVQHYGIFASDVTELTIVGNQVRNVLVTRGTAPLAAISVGTGAIGAFITDNVTSESEIGIEIQNVKSATSRNNRISGSLVAGIRVSDSLLLRLEGDQIVDTHPGESAGSALGIGVELLENSTVTLSGVEIRKSFGYGLWVSGGTEALVEESAIVQTVGNPGVPGRGAGVQEGLLEITSSTIAQ